MAEPRQYPRTVDLTTDARSRPTGATRETPTHSPAPWWIDSRDLVGQDTLHDARGNYLALLDSTSGADDRLILKAPDLLAVVRELVLTCEHWQTTHAPHYTRMKALVDHIDGGRRMSDALLAKVRERVERVLRASEEGTTTRGEDLSAILAVVETALVLARREGYTGGSSASNTLGAARFTYPLPTRTRQVLREEPVPGRRHSCLFRVRDGVLERNCNGDTGDKALWELHADICMVPPVGAWDLMAHALDLHANPYRTEQVPADESDPWGEGAP